MISTIDKRPVRYSSTRVTSGTDVTFAVYDPLADSKENIVTDSSTHSQVSLTTSRLESFRPAQVPSSIPGHEERKYIWVVEDYDTSLEKRPNIVTSQVITDFEKARKELEKLFFVREIDTIFEDGVESPFSRELIRNLEKYGNVALEVLFDLILHARINPELAAEALRWLGYIENHETHEYRRWLLERSLECSSPRVRDGALLGLASLDDPKAIPSLKLAIEKEQVSELRHDMEQTILQLESSR